MIDAHRIVYNGLDSLDLDLTPHLSFGSENGATSSFLEREAISTEIYDGSRRFIHSSKYTDSAMPRFTLIKQNFGDFTPEENRRVLSWLTSNDKPSWLEVYQDDSNVISYRYFCVPTTVEQYKLSNGRVVGYEFEIFSDAPYAWSRQFTYPEVYALTEKIDTNDKTNTYLQVNGAENFKIDCNTDEYNKLIYPKVVIDFNGTDIYFPVATRPEDAKMIPNVIYTFVEDSTQKYSVNISTEKVRYDVKHIESNVIASEGVLNEYPTNRFYDSDSNVIKKIVGKGTTEEPYVWETVVKVGAAVKFDVAYTHNGQTVSKEIIVKGVTLGETVILDGTNKVISVIPDDDVRVIGEDFNWEWLPLAYGENDITISGNCLVQIQWIEPRKVGSL